MCYTVRMEEEIVKRLTRLSAEEENILRGQGAIRRDDYALTEEFIVNSRKLLGSRLIDLRPHTRFVDFPEHGHDYMEFMYVYAGSVTHGIGGEKVTLHSGDILFLNRHIRHSVQRAERDDIGINFILSDPFVKSVFGNVEQNPVMSEFLTRNLDAHGEGEYLFFRTAGNFPIRSLMNCLIYSLVAGRENDPSLFVQLVALLFSYLAQYRDTLVNGLRFPSAETQFRRSVSAYVRQRYPDAHLHELADRIGYDPSYLSGKIRRTFGKTFGQLVQEERLVAARRLLCTTQMRVDAIIRSVGYENQTHFHRLFRRAFGMTPHALRMAARANAQPPNEPQ